MMPLTRATSGVTRGWPMAMLTAAVFAAGACAGTSQIDLAGPVSSTDGLTLPAELTLTHGASADVPAAALRVRFDTVVSDSRCPATVQCVWAGSATVRLTATSLGSAGGTRSLTLATEPRKDTATVYGQLLRLTRVDPQLVTMTPISPLLYRVTLTVGADK